MVNKMAFSWIVRLKIFLVLVTVKGDVLKHITSISSNIFRPLFTEVPFTIVCPEVAVRVTLPRWNTHGLVPHTVKCLTNVGQIGLLRVDGSYKYHTEVRKDCVDRLKLNIEVRATTRAARSLEYSSPCD